MGEIDEYLILEIPVQVRRNDNHKWYAICTFTSPLPLIEYGGD